jgi:hypothetical protein
MLLEVCPFYISLVKIKFTIAYLQSKYMLLYSYAITEVFAIQKLMLTKLYALSLSYALGRSCSI